MEPDRVVLSSSPTAVVRAEMAQAEIPQRIGGLFDAVYSVLPSSPATQNGQNVAVYTPAGEGRLTVEVGVQVAAPFDGSDALACSSLPAGHALHIRHVGSYGLIGQTYGEIFAWATEHDVAHRGITVEIYGDHDPDPEKLVTDLYVMLVD